jgi:3-dehydroquinate synthase
LHPIQHGDIAQTFPKWLSEQSYRQIFTITDENTLRYCWPTFSEGLAGTGLLPPMVIPAGERHKNLATCEQIWRAMLNAQLDRKALVVNLGGGVIGDMGGFCGATWKRGLDIVQIPTTLLSMTDAAIGGKLGIDFHNIKNTIGVFQYPAAVFVDTTFLRTLPARELLSGFAEVLKHALIGDPALWQTLQQPLHDGLLSYHSFNWPALLEASIAVKVRVVTEDPLEKGLRMILNYGHTIGHAVESLLLETADPMTHGEAVAFGMIAESRIAYGATSARCRALEQVIRRYFPERALPDELANALWPLMQQDKKNMNGAVRMAVPADAPYTMLVKEIQYNDLT